MSPRAAKTADNTIGWDVGFPLVVFAWHWVIIQSAATLAGWIGGVNAPSPPYGRMPDPMTGLAHTLVEPFRNWDGLWYTLIAQTGYVGGTESAKAAFWPLFPWLMQAGSTITGLAPETVGYLIANISFAFALIVIYRLVRLDFTDRVAIGSRTILGGRNSSIWTSMQYGCFRFFWAWASMPARTCPS